MTIAPQPGDWFLTDHGTVIRLVAPVSNLDAWLAQSEPGDPFSSSGIHQFTCEQVDRMAYEGETGQRIPPEVASLRWQGATVNGADDRGRIIWQTTLWGSGRRGLAAWLPDTYLRGSAPPMFGLDRGRLL